MRKIALMGIATLLTIAVVGSWVMTHTTAKSPAAAPAAMAPLQMMMNTDNLPVHQIVDAI
jgi:hypothetical protein